MIQDPANTTGLAIDPTGRFLASSASGWLRLYSLPQRAALSDRDVKQGKLRRIAFADAGRALLAAGRGGTALVSMETGTRLSLARADAPIRDADMAREGRNGFALEGVAPPVLAAFEVVGGGGEESARRVERGAWPVSEACDAVRTDDRGELGMVLCGKEVHLFRVAGEGRTLATTAPAEDGWVSRDGRWAVLARPQAQPRLAWLDLEEGREVGIPIATSATGPGAEVRAVLGLFGSPPELLALVREPSKDKESGPEDWLVSARPGGAARLVARVGEPVEAAAYDPLHDLFVLGRIGGLTIVDRGGQALGQLGATVRPITSLRHDPVTDRLWAEVMEGVLNGGARELDLAEGELRQVPAEGPSPAALVDLSVDEGKARVSDRRQRKVVWSPSAGIEGVGPAALRWGARISPAAALVAGPATLGLVDLATLRLERWTEIPADPVPTFASHLEGTDLLLVLRPEGRLEAWSLSTGRQVAAQATPWRGAPGVSPLRAVARLPGGALLFGASAGLFRSEALGEPIRPVAEEEGIDAIVVAPDGARLVVEAMGAVRVCLLGEHDILGRCARLLGSSPAFLRGGAELAIVSNGGVQLYRFQDGALLVTAWAGTGSDYLLVTPEGHYKATPGGLALGAWVEGTRLRTLEEVDLERNRPAEVLERLGRASPEQVAWWRAAEARRRRRSAEWSPSPGSPADVSLQLLAVPPAWSPEAALRLPLRIEVGRHPPVRLFLRVNGIPVPGRAGLPVAGAGTAGAVVETAAQVPIGPGENRVAVSAVDAQGHESRAAQFVVTGTGSRRPGRILFLGIGVSDYPDPGHRLAYASKDVSDVASALKPLSGGALRTHLLLDRQATRGGVLAARAFLEEARLEDLVVLYLAGHGLVDPDGTWRFATVDQPFGQPGTGGLTMADLEELLDGLGAGARVLFIDACHAGSRDPGAAVAVGGADEVPGGGEGVRVRGLRQRPGLPGGAAPGTQKARASLFADLRRGTGTTIIAAAGAEEFAFEGPGTANGLFTHAVLQSLHEGTGVTPAGELWLEALVGAVRGRVVALTAGGQVPEVRDGNPGFRRPLLASPPLRQLFRPGQGAEVRGFAASRGGTALALVTDGGVSVVTSAGVLAQAATLPPDADGAGLCRPACRLRVSGDGRTLVAATSQRVLVLDASHGGWRTAARGTPAGISDDGRWALVDREGQSVAVELSRGREVAVPAGWRSCTWSSAPATLRCLTGDVVTEWDPASGRMGVVWRLPAVSTSQEVEDPRSWSLAPGGRVALEAPLFTDREGVHVAYDVGTGHRTELPTGDAILLRHDDPWPREGYWNSTVRGGGEPGEVPLLDLGGKARATLRILGTASIARERGDLLLDRERIISREWRGGLFSFAELEANGSLFRIHDASTGEAVGWFGVPLKQASLAHASEGAVYVIDRRTGAVYRMERPAGAAR